MAWIWVRDPIEPGGLTFRFTYYQEEIKLACFADQGMDCKAIAVSCFKAYFCLVVEMAHYLSYCGVIGAGDTWLWSRLTSGGFVLWIAF